MKKFTSILIETISLVIPALMGAIWAEGSKLHSNSISILIIIVFILYEVKIASESIDVSFSYKKGEK